MIIWLASYPKSGNTFLRSLLTSYLLTDDGKFDEKKLKEINQFPNLSLFKNLGVDTSDDLQIVKNYVKAQEKINSLDANKIRFIKTHSSLNDINGYKFTDLKNTLGVIYIVRDPRNVVSSWAKFASQSVEQAADTMIQSYRFGGDMNKSEKSLVYMGTWNSNFNSWKSFKDIRRYLLIKYEDLIKDRDLELRKILKFLCNLQGVKFQIDQKKFKNVIESTGFERMQKLEKEQGFREAKVNLKTGEKIPFFNLGPKNDWKKLLDPKIKEKIEKAFKKEMTELNYL